MRRLAAGLRGAKGSGGDGMTRFSALVVDDDAGFRESLALLVARTGCQVREAASLAEARERLAESGADVIRVDHGLPDGSGIQLLHDEAIAANSEVIVITGNATVDSAVQALREGALDYLTKPLDHARLGSVLTGVLRSEERRVGKEGRS